jgi:hypothetical protein
MRRLIKALCSLFVFVIIFSCEQSEVLNFNDKGSFKSSKEYIPLELLNFDFKKYNIQPNWKKAVKIYEDIYEVSFKINNKDFKPRVDGPLQKYKRSEAKLIIQKRAEEILVEIFYIFPNNDFEGNLDDINVNSVNTKKFSGMCIRQQLGQSKVDITYFIDGNVTTKKTGSYVPNSSNARINQECTLWGMFFIHYNEYGQEQSSELLYTWRVCEGGAIDEDQPSPDQQGTQINNGPVNQQLLLNVKNVFYWLSLNSDTWASIIFTNLESCNIYGILSSPSGPANDYSSYQVGSSDLGTCLYGNWTPTSNLITNIIPLCQNSPCSTYSVETFHGGNINIDIEQSISIVPGQVGGVLKLNQAHGGSLVWIKGQ